MVAFSGTQSMHVNRQIITTGDCFEVRGDDGVVQIGAIKLVHCQANGTGLAVVE